MSVRDPRSHAEDTGSDFAALDATSHDRLYGDPDRLGRRTRALRAAKIAGADATEVVVTLGAAVTARGARIADIGCGRGSTSLRLAATLTPESLVLIDRSAALLRLALERLHDDGHPAASAICADFHRLPLRQDSVDLAVAAFCLYHSATPGQVVRQIGTILAKKGGNAAGHAVLATKSSDSYDELDHLMATTGLDPDAPARPSLYATCDSATVEEIADMELDVIDVVHQQHTFLFRGHRHLADYLSTVPKYRLTHDLGKDTSALAEELSRRGAPKEVATTSTVTFVLARARR